MNKLTTLLLSLLFAGSFLLIIPATALKYAFSETYSSHNTTATSSFNTTPVILFPTEKEVKALFGQENYQNKPISNITNGPIINITGVVDRNNTSYVVWLDDKDHVWLAVSHGSNANNSTLSIPGDYRRHPDRNFTEPIVITPPNSKNVTNLQIAADGYETAIVWKSYNQTSGKNNIFGALTRDGGATWSVHILSNEKANAENPLLVNPKVVFYVGENEQACKNPYDSSAAIASNMTGLNIACFHPW
jgi:hypothetical protein